MKKATLTLLCLFLSIPCYARTITINADRSGDYLYIDEPSEAIDGCKGNESILENLGYAPNQIIVKFRQPAADSLYSQFQQGAHANGLQFSDSLQKLNNKYKLKKAKPLFENFKKNRERAKVLLRKDKPALTDKQKRILRRLKRAPKDAKGPELDRIYKIKFDLEPGQFIHEVVEAYNNDPDVEYAELNYKVSVYTTPNDPLYPIQWPLNNTGQVYPESGNYNHPPGAPDSDIDAPEAWEIITGDSNIVVAVIDTGVDYKHRDLAGNMWVNEAEFNGTAGVDDDGNGYIDDVHGYVFAGLFRGPDPFDDNGHGTYCAGIIAAEGDNGLDITGVCWNAGIMALKSLDWLGVGWTADSVEAFYYAVQNDADIISCSWGSSYDSQTLKDAVDYARSQGVIIVASAGNGWNTAPRYPANYENVISVAATDSNDQKAIFTTYGDWVDIAAPGVDILSLRATGTSRGTVYDDYTIIGSGTSAACPHVAGVYALLLSFWPEIQLDALEKALFESTDPIDPQICIWGRLNAHQAILQIPRPEGVIFLDSEDYNCSALIKINLLDSDLQANDTQQVSIETDGGDFETIVLKEADFLPGLFTGIIYTDSGRKPRTGDGIAQVTDGQIITAAYEDVNDGTGSPATVTDEAVIDCQAPEIFNVRIDPVGPQPAVSFETDEPTTARVLCGVSRKGQKTIIGTCSELSTSHTIKLSGVLPWTRYFFIVEAMDAAGNRIIDGNRRRYYRFRTDGPGEIQVPTDYGTIQVAIDHCWDGGSVCVLPGVYTGPGNIDLDFRGKAITVSGTNPDDPNIVAATIIDCNGSEDNPHRGFYFHSGEDANSVLSGLTITNGYRNRGAGIFCVRSSPTITNCIISKNDSLGYAAFGGGIYCEASSFRITNCTLDDNSAFEGGGIFSQDSDLEITSSLISQNYGRLSSGIKCKGGNLIMTDCIVTANTPYPAINCQFTDSAVIRDCTIADNRSNGIRVSEANEVLIADCNVSNNGGRGISCSAVNSVITNCLITGNNSSGISSGGFGMKIVNCIISGNKADRGGGIECYGGYDTLITNCIISGNTTDGFGGGGGIFSLTNSPPKIVNCTITGNTANKDYGGGIRCFKDSPIITNCIIWNNSHPQISLWLSSFPILTYTNIEGGWLGEGNIDTDPCFVQPAYWDANSTWIDGDYHLLEDSPCINAGDPCYPYDSNETDLDGKPRIIDGRIDIGAYEFNLNTAPVAVAGPDQTAYAWIDGYAEVTLYGSGSYDDDSDPLTYLWTWEIEPNVYEANGVSPTIELPVGEHIIELVVNDGMDDSGPNCTTVTVIEPLHSFLRIMPRTINRKSRQRYILAWLRLPAGISKDDIDENVPLNLYPGDIEASRQFIFQNNRYNNPGIFILAFFKKKDLMTAVGEDGPVQLDVVGQLNTGRYFFGQRTIRIINPPHHRGRSPSRR